MKATRRITTLALAIAAATCASAWAAEVTVFKQPNFGGDKLTLRRDTQDLTNAGFQDQISSIEVRSGRWEFCSQPDFAGQCVTLDRGRYPHLAAQLNHRIESAREVSRVAMKEQGRDNDRRQERSFGADRDRYAAGYGRADGRYDARGAVELFAGRDFQGPALGLDRDADALDNRLVERGVSSLVVREGRWQACTRPGYEGHCEVFEPGRYADLGRLGNRISSLRRVG